MGSEELYLDILNNLKDGIYFVNKYRQINFWNKAAEDITGYKAEEITGKECRCSGLDHIDEKGHPLCEMGCPLYKTVIDGKHRQERVFVRHKEGYRIPVYVNIFPIEKNGVIEGAVEVFTKDSPKVYEADLVERLSDIAIHDELTKLPNRRYIESFLQYKLDEFNRFGRGFAVLFADIDNFSSFNNDFGHKKGDQVLKNIGVSIKQSVRRNDLIGRWGGEEFVGIYSVNGEDEIPIIGERFRVMVEGTEVNGPEGSLSVTASVGITIVNKEDTLESIIERADELMYKSKKSGKNKVTVG